MKLFYQYFRYQLHLTYQFSPQHNTDPRSGDVCITNSSVLLLSITVSTFLPKFHSIVFTSLFFSLFLVFFFFFQCSAFEPKNFLPNSVCFRREVMGACSPLQTSFQHLETVERKNGFTFVDVSLLKHALLLSKNANTTVCIQL